MTLACSRFSSISLYNESFSSFARFRKSAPNKPNKNGLDIFKVENTDMHATLYTPEAEIFPVSLYDEPLIELYHFFVWQVHRNDPK